MSEPIPQEHVVTRLLADYGSGFDEGDRLVGRSVQRLFGVSADPTCRMVGSPLAPRSSTSVVASTLAHEGARRVAVVTVIVDTTTTFPDVMKKRTSWMQLLTLCADGKVELVVPRVVLEETARHWAKQAQEAVDIAEERVAKLLKSQKSMDYLELGEDMSPIPEAPKPALDPKQFLEKTSQKLLSLGVNIAPLPDQSTSRRCSPVIWSARSPSTMQARALDWDWSEHYAQVVFPVEAHMVFQIRVEQGMDRVEECEFEGIEPLPSP